MIDTVEEKRGPGRPKKNLENIKMKQLTIVIPEDLYWDIKSLVVKKRESLGDFFTTMADREVRKEKKRSLKYENSEDWNI